jgi:hypothetical protein
MIEGNGIIEKIYIVIMNCLTLTLLALNSDPVGNGNLFHGIRCIFISSI